MVPELPVGTVAVQLAVMIPELDPVGGVAVMVTGVELEAFVEEGVTVTSPLTSVKVNSKSCVPVDVDDVKVADGDGDDKTYPLAMAVTA